MDDDLVKTEEVDIEEFLEKAKYGRASFKRIRYGLRPQVSQGLKRPRYGAKKQRVMTPTRTTKPVLKKRNLKRRKKSMDDADYQKRKKQVEVDTAWKEHKDLGSKYLDRSQKEDQFLKRQKQQQAEKTKQDYLRGAPMKKAEIFKEKDFGIEPDSSTSKSLNIDFKKSDWIFFEAPPVDSMEEVFKAAKPGTVDEPAGDYHEMRETALGKNAAKHLVGAYSALKEGSHEKAKGHMEKFHGMFNPNIGSHVSFKKQMVNKLGASKDKHWGQVHGMASGKPRPTVKKVQKPSPQEMQAQIEAKYHSGKAKKAVDLLQDIQKGVPALGALAAGAGRALASGAGRALASGAVGGAVDALTSGSDSEKSAKTKSKKDMKKMAMIGEGDTRGSARKVSERRNTSQTRQQTHPPTGVRPGTIKMGRGGAAAPKKTYGGPISLSTKSGRA